MNALPYQRLARRSVEVANWLAEGAGRAERHTSPPAASGTAAATPRSSTQRSPASGPLTRSAVERASVARASSRRTTTDSAHRTGRPLRGSRRWHGAGRRRALRSRSDPPLVESEPLHCSGEAPSSPTHDPGSERDCSPRPARRPLTGRRLYRRQPGAAPLHRAGAEVPPSPARLLRYPKTRGVVGIRTRIPFHINDLRDEVSKSGTGRGRRGSPGGPPRRPHPGRARRATPRSSAHWKPASGPMTWSAVERASAARASSRRTTTDSEHRTGWPLRGSRRWPRGGPPADFRSRSDPPLVESDALRGSGEAPSSSVHDPGGERDCSPAGRTAADRCRFHAAVGTGRTRAGAEVTPSPAILLR